MNRRGPSAAGGSTLGVADEVGTITPDRYADIIAVEGDVLRHIALLSDVDVAVKRGRRVK